MHLGNLLAYKESVQNVVHIVTYSLPAPRSSIYLSDQNRLWKMCVTEWWNRGEIFLEKREYPPRLAIGISPIGAVRLKRGEHYRFSLSHPRVVAYHVTDVLWAFTRFDERKRDVVTFAGEILHRDMYTHTHTHNSFLPVTCDRVQHGNPIPRMDFFFFFLSMKRKRNQETSPARAALAHIVSPSGALGVVRFAGPCPQRRTERRPEEKRNHSTL